MSVEHLEGAIRESRSIAIAIGAVHSEVVGSAPHATGTVVHVEAFLALVDRWWLGRSRTVIQVTNLWVFADFLFDNLNLSLEDSPEAPVLDSLNLDYVCIRKSLLELSFNLLKLRALLL